MVLIHDLCKLDQMELLKFYGKDIQELDFKPWLEGKPEALRPIARKWFEAIQNVGADVQAIFHDNYPIGCVEEAPFAYINVFIKHVNVGFFYGVDLPDPAGLLEGTGKRMRHIKLKPELHNQDEHISNLIIWAYEDIKARLLTQ